MEVNSTDKKTFQLTDNGTQIGEIIYENLFFLKAEINLSNSEKYKIAPVGIFGRSISVTQNETQIANLYLSWSGEIVITFQDGQEYILKLNGIFSNKYTIENRDKEKLIQLEAKFNWIKFHYRYDITYNIEPENKVTENTLLLLLSVYSANFFIATMSGANAGMM